MLRPAGSLGSCRFEGLHESAQTSFLSGAAQESNLPSVGLPRLTGFEGLLRKVQPSTEAGFRPRFSPSRCGEERWDRYQFRYQVGTRQLVRQRAVTVPMSRVVRALLHRADWWRLDSTA